MRGNEHGWTSLGVAGPIAAGIVLLGAFVLWERRTPEPMVPLRFFRNRAFSAANVTSLLMSFGMFGSIFLLAQFFQVVQGYSPLEAGLRTLPWTAMPIFVAPIAGLFSDRIGARPLLVAGMALMAGGLAWIAIVTSPTVAYAELVPAFVMAGVGMSLYFAPVANLVLSTVRRKEEGKASGVNNTIREVGGVFGVAVLASVFSAVGRLPEPAGVRGRHDRGGLGRRRSPSRWPAWRRSPSRRARTSCPTPSRCSSAANARAAPPASWRASRTRRRDAGLTSQPRPPGSDERAQAASAFAERFTASPRGIGRELRISLTSRRRGAAHMEDLLHHTAARAIRYLRDLPERSVAPQPDAIAGLERFDERLPEHPDDPERVIALLDEAGSPATMASAGPRFFGFVIGGSHPVAVAANWLAAAWDQNAGASTASPTAAALEQVAQRWLSSSSACRPPPSRASSPVAPWPT